MVYHIILYYIILYYIILYYVFLLYSDIVHSGNLYYYNICNKDHGFSAVFVTGPVERGIIVESPHNRREENMCFVCYVEHTSSPNHMTLGCVNKAAPHELFVIRPIPSKGVLLVRRLPLAAWGSSSREENMWAFAKAALDLLAECVREAEGLAYMYMCMCVCVCIYIYIYILTCFLFSFVLLSHVCFLV